MPHTHPVSLTAARPWEVGESARTDLLAWFREADLSEAANVARLLDLTGRRGSPDAEIIPIGRELGGWRIEQPVPRATFVRIYGDLQRYLREALSYWQRAVKERNRQQRELLADLALGRIRQERADVSIDVERDALTGAVTWPTQATRPTPVRRTASLAGELAMALLDEFLAARTAGLCAICHEPWLSPLRKQRRLCGRVECLRAWRNKHRSPEDPARVYERVKRSRAARAKRGKGR